MLQSYHINLELKFINDLCLENNYTDMAELNNYKNCKTPNSFNNIKVIKKEKNEITDGKSTINNNCK